MLAFIESTLSALPVYVVAAAMGAVVAGFGVCYSVGYICGYQSGYVTKQRTQERKKLYADLQRSKRNY